MKKFIVKFIFFLLILIFLLVGMDILSMLSPFNRYLAKVTNSSVNRDGSAEIEPRIEWVRNEGQTKKLILGDSVANQLFINLRGNNENYCIATSNQAITIAGQYILLNEYIENHDQIEDVYLIIVPESLGTDLGTRLSYQYVVMPFWENDCQKYLDHTTVKRLEDMFGSFFLHKNIIKSIDLSCINRKIYLNLMNMEHDTDMAQEPHISDITLQYLVKINNLCAEKNISFHLLPAPVADISERHMKVENLEIAYQATELNMLFPDYFEQIHYYPEGQFGDGVHFVGIYEEQELLNEKIEDIVGSNESLQGLLELIK